MLWVGGSQGVTGGSPDQVKEILKIGACLFHFLFGFFLQVLKQMTRKVTGFLLILEIQLTIRWRVEKCEGVGGMEGLDE